MSVYQALRPKLLSTSEHWELIEAWRKKFAAMSRVEQEFCEREDLAAMKTDLGILAWETANKEKSILERYGSSEFVMADNIILFCPKH